MAIVVEALANGPYLVKNLPTLTNSKGETLPTKDVIALCRCGHATTKPFCSGTHNRGICAHTGFCTDNLREVFRLREEPWIDPRGTAAEAIPAVVRMCPSAALSYSLGAVEHRDQERAPAILVSQNGPYFVTGGIELVDVPWGEGASREHYVLCRCGQSKNKPFCDGSHWAAEFTDDAN